MTSDAHFLRMAFRINATFSFLCAAVALFGGADLAETLGITDPSFLPVLAASLAVFAAFLVWLSFRPVISPALGWGVVAADVAWVVGTAPVVLAEILTSVGDQVAVGVAICVGLCAVLQAVGLRRMQAVVIA